MMLEWCRNNVNNGTYKVGNKIYRLLQLGVDCGVKFI